PANSRVAFKAANSVREVATHIQRCARAAADNAHSREPRSGRWRDSAGAAACASFQRTTLRITARGALDTALWIDDSSGSAANEKAARTTAVDAATVSALDKQSAMMHDSAALAAARRRARRSQRSRNMGSEDA
ncbi:hypothetical protein Dimus_037437, partial [Dionaea muscipula]